MEQRRDYGSCLRRRCHHQYSAHVSQTSLDGQSLSVQEMDSNQTVSVLTLNVFPGSPLPYIWNGTPKLAKSDRLGQQCDFMAKHQPDIVCLQEMYCHWSRGYLLSRLPQYDMVSLETPNVQGLLWAFVLWFLSACSIAMFVKSVDRAPVFLSDIIVYCVSLAIGRWVWLHTALEEFLIGDATGLTILYRKSRWRIGDNGVRQFKAQEGDWMNSVAPRGFAHASFELKQDTRIQIGVFNTHLNALGEDRCRENQVKELLCMVRTNCSFAKPHATIVCGDFNTGPTSDAVRRMVEEGFTDCGHVSGCTWDNANSMTKGWSRCVDERIDFTFHKNHFGPLLSRKESKIVLHDPPTSDHYGLMTTFEVTP